MSLVITGISALVHGRDVHAPSQEGAYMPITVDCLTVGHVARSFQIAAEKQHRMRWILCGVSHSRVIIVAPAGGIMSQKGQLEFAIVGLPHWK